ncbi:MAG: PD-(D/E)XK nuclease family protein [Mogibacterium sp.]|nr:PD-(D/E)XK nuclease family protein [Mogibacterium sp.]
MLRLFAGRENIDKERFIYDRVSEHGGETLVLVPDQYTLVAEEQALKYLGTDCLFSTEIISMNRLGLRILTEQGTESVRMIDKYGRFMLLSMLIREHADDFDIFSRVAGKLTFTSMLNDFISEFKQQDCSIEKLQEMSGDAGGDPILEAKLKELSGVITAYEEAIEGRYTDSEDYIAMYVSAIKDSKLVRGKNIWIYGYDSITPKFADAVIELAKTAGSVNFIVNESDFGLDKRLIASLTRLCADNSIDVAAEFIPALYEMQKSETIKRMEKSLWKDVLSPAERAENSGFVPEDLTVVCAANPYYEAESAAAYVWHLIRDLGYRMREIQIIANDEGAMQPVIRRVFAEYGLPVFADTSRDITDSAAVGFIVNLLGFPVHRKSSQFLFAMLKTGLTDYDDSDIEDLENYAREYRIKGSMWDKPFRYGRDALGEEVFSRLESVRAGISEKISGLAAIAKDATVAEFIKDFRTYLADEWNLEDKVAEAAAAMDEAGLHDEAQRMTQSFAKAIELLGQMDIIMGDSAMDLAEFTDIYVAGLSDVEVGVIPPSVDGLSMGTMIRTRPRQVKAAVILGACEGVMPLSPQTEGLFSVDEKEFFKSRGFALGSLDDIKMDEENAAMYRMMARPSEKIYISWAMTDTEGRDTNPSPVIDSLRMLFPRIEADGLIRKDIISKGRGDSLKAGESDVINTAGDGMRQLINRIKDTNAPDEPDALTRAMIRWYADNRKDELDTMFRAAAYDNVQHPLGRNAAKDLFCRKDGSLSLSASSIGSYIDCPFRYFIDRGLRPKEERAFASDARSVGDVYHECLMAVARQIMKADEIPDDDSLEELVTAALDELSESYMGGLFVSTGCEEYRMSRIREICASAAKAMASQLAAESVVSASFEEPFGRHAKLEPIRINAGDGEVYVEGKIDRADIMEIGGESRVRIIDYKTGSDKLDLWKMRQGYKMQLMIYLISATSGDLTPAGMFYFNIKDPIESINDKSEKQIGTLLEKEAEDEFKLKGAFINEEGVLRAMPEKVLSSSKGAMSREEYEEVRGEVIARIEDTAEGILSGKIGINPLKVDNRLACGYCSYKSVCRRDRGYVKNSYRQIKPKPKEKE